MITATKTFIDDLKKINACSDAIVWAEHYVTFDEAWSKCERGDWMLWLVGKLSGEPESDSRKKLVLAACKCARLALNYVKAGDERPRLAIETAEKHARNEGPTLKDVRASAASAAAAAAAAYAAASAADAAAAASAYAAAYAADAAAAASAYAAAYAADAAAYAAADAAAYAAADAAARTKTLKQCADTVREFYPEPPVII